MKKLLPCIFISILFTACVPEQLQDSIENNIPLMDSNSDTSAPISSDQSLDEYEEPPKNTSLGPIIAEDDDFVFPITGVQDAYFDIHVLDNDEDVNQEELMIVDFKPKDLDIEIVSSRLNCIVPGPNCDKTIYTLRVKRVCDVPKISYTVQNESGDFAEAEVHLSCATSCNGPCPPGASPKK